MKAGLKLAVAVVLAVGVAVVGWRMLQSKLFKEQQGRGGLDDSVLRMTDAPITNAADTAGKTAQSLVASGGALPQAKAALSTKGMDVEEVEEEESLDDEEEEETSAERAVKKWEDLAESLMEAEFGADANLSKKIKEAFDALETEEDQLEGMQAMMNLISDGAVQALVPILLDTQYSEDILDIIFSDILNRDDEIKYPILEEIVKNVNHPNFVDAAHILEVTKPDEGPQVIEEVEL